LSFWRHKKYDNTDKNAVNSAEYERIVRKLIDANAEIETLKASIKLLQTDVDNLRGNFNRKLKGIEQTEKIDTKDINTSELISIG
jgi:hypothetical protein